MDSFSHITIHLIEVLAIAWLVWNRLNLSKKVPVIKKGESNVTVKRDGDKVVMVDQEGKPLDIKQIIK